MKTFLAEKNQQPALTIGEDHPFTIFFPGFREPPEAEVVTSLFETWAEIVARMVSSQINLGQGAAARVRTLAVLPEREIDLGRFSFRELPPEIAPAQANPPVI